MESIQYLLRFLFKLSIIVFFAALVWWGVVTFNPGFRLYSLVGITNASSTDTTDGDSGWLPSPRAFKGLFGTPKTPDPNNGKGIVYGQVFNGYGNNQLNSGQFDYIAYRKVGVEMTQGNGPRPMISYSNQDTSLVEQSTTTSLEQNSLPYGEKGLFIRNISIYEGGHAYTGLAFTGEARESMFIDGKFPIIIAELSTGKAVSVSYAEATTKWTVPGWVRFQVKINSVLPNKVPCLMVFEQARAQASQHVQPVRVVIPVSCN